MEIGNQMQYHKLGTISELTYEDGSICSSIISIKIIGSERCTVIPITTVRGPLKCLRIGGYTI